MTSRAGIGRALIDAMVALRRYQAVTRLVVATAAADTGNRRFYQRQGFRLLRIERDAFGPETGYLGPTPGRHPATGPRLARPGSPTMAPRSAA